MKNIFSSEMPDYWNIFEDPSQLKKVLEDSDSTPQLIYKHSHRCSTCIFTKKEVEEVAEMKAENVAFHFVDVIASRSVSNTIAEELNIQHESPQLILINNGKVIWHKSHGAIKSKASLEALEKLD